MPRPSVIPCDLSCSACEYNLHGLDPTGACPECGSAISPSIIRQRRFASIEEATFSISWYDHLRETAASACGLPLDAVDLIPAAIAQAFKVMMAPQLSAGHICVGAFHVALKEFGRDTLKELDHLGLRTSCDVGLAVFALIDVGLVTPSAGDCISDFAGLPSMADLWAMASRPGHDWFALTLAPPRARDREQPHGEV